MRIPASVTTATALQLKRECASALTKPLPRPDRILAPLNALLVLSIRMAYHRACQGFCCSCNYYYA
jgi:hypothetical protein